MRCEECQGTGFVKVFEFNQLADGHQWHLEVCQVCQGSGVTYCCDEAGANPPNTWSSK